MLAKVFSAAVFGVEAYDLEVEVSDDGGQKDAIVIVGLPMPPCARLAIA
jgi:hypothetical protein